VPSPDRRRTAGFAVALAASLAVASGCDDSQLAASRYVKRLLVSARTGGIIEIRAEDSRELAGTRLVIAPDALAADTIITVELRTRPLARSPAGPAVAFGPSGTELRREAQLVLPADATATAEPERLLIEAGDDDGWRWTLPGPDTTMGPGDGFVHTGILRLAAFQTGRRPLVLCRSVAFSEGGPPAAQFTSVHSPLPRRRSMTARATLVGALAAGCALIGCQEPSQSIAERTDPVEQAQAAGECLETCGNEAREALQRCRDARTDEAACISRHRSHLGACLQTCGAPCAPVPPAPPPAPAPPVVTPCHVRCVETHLESNRRCDEQGTDLAACRARAQEASDACLRACAARPPVPPPPVPPATPPAPPQVTPCHVRCVETHLESNRRCDEQGTDVAACKARAQEASNACLRACSVPPAGP
jgi:hypothetical protein